ncbi:hypothetical protein ACP4OV_016367 [Aristida adscensionis]
MISMAPYLPTLFAVPKPFNFLATHFSHSLSLGLAKASPRSNVCSVKAAGYWSTKLSAWTSVRQERWEGDLPVEGHIPDWLNGTYLRNGPGLWELGDHAFDHIFDGYATLVRVTFRRGRATGAHRQIESDAYRAARAHGRPLLREFSQLCAGEPSLLDAVGLATGAALSDNANISVVPLGDGRVVCLTEATKGSIEVRPETLDTIGRFRYTDGLWGLVQSTHPVVTSSELLTIVPDFLRRSYTVVRMASGSNERGSGGEGALPGRPDAGVGALVRHHGELRRRPGDAAPVLGSRRALAAPDAFLHLRLAAGRRELCACHLQVHRNELASVEVPPFITFHFINAYEEKREDGLRIVADCCEYYADPAIVKEFALHRLRSPRADKDPFPDARVARFTIPLDGSPSGDLETALEPEEHGRGVELSTINPAYRGREYRHVYACGARRPCKFFNTLTKIDLVAKEAKNWHEEGAVPSEPFFVGRPGATNEDDGVVISIISTVDGDGYALLLDAATFNEIARVRFPYGLPFGFHGCWIPENILT